MAISQSQRLRHTAQKAARRKAVLAQRRTADLAMNVGAEARQISDAAKGPVRTCMMSERLFDAGMGRVVLSRTLPSGQVAASFFLVDVWCLGIKDAFFQVMPAWSFEEKIKASSEDEPDVDLHPSVARKLLHDAAAYAQSLGFAPSPAFGQAEALFGDIAMATQTFTFGKDGKAFYISGPNDTTARIRHIMQMLAKSRGADGFDYMVGVDDLDDLDDADDLD
jgi:hypothetical protein